MCSIYLKNKLKGSTCSLLRFSRSILFVTAGIVLFCFSCNEKEEEKTVPHPALEGTSWKLKGIVDMQTGILTENNVLLKRCKSCYIITFDTDSTASGYAEYNSVTVRLWPRLSMNMSLNGINTNTDSYAVEGDNLKFFFNIEKKYVLFTRYEEDSNEIDEKEGRLEGTMWQLEGLVDAQTGTLMKLKILHPSDSHRIRYYHIGFHSDRVDLESGYIPRHLGLEPGMYSILDGYTSNNGFHSAYIADYETGSFKTLFYIATKAGESQDGLVYAAIFQTSALQSFSLQGNELILYYNNKNNYLLYKRI